MAYLNSEKIKIFPSAKRGVTKPYSRLTTEQSFVKIVNKLIDTDGFVINLDRNELEFNIHGYYINADLTSLTELFPSSLNIYAKIKLVQVGDNFELDGVDDAIDEEYKGVQFSDTSSTLADGEYELKVLSRETDADNWTIPEESEFKFTNKSFNFDIIVDGGII